MEFLAFGSFAVLVALWLVAPSDKGEIVATREVEKAA